MEENEKKEIEKNGPEAPKGTEEKPVENGSDQPEGKGGRLDAIKGKAKIMKDKTKETATIAKQKTGEFMSVKRNKIIVGACSAAAIIALVVGLSVGLTQCSGSGHGLDTSTSSNSSTSSKGDDKSSSSSSGSSSSSNSAHTHDYGSAWKSDANSHWHECSCGEKSENAAHTFGTEIEIVEEATESKAGLKGYKCSVCDYAKDTYEYTPYINSGNFEASLKFTGEKLTVHCDTVSGGKASEDTETKNGNILHCVATGDGAADIYYTVEGEGADAKYYAYFKNSDGLWLKSEDEEKYYDVYSSFDTKKSAFDSAITYDKIKNSFDTSKGAYVTSYTNQYGTEINAELYFNNGKLVKAVKSYRDVVRTYTFLEDAETITLPSVHVHNVTSGSLDLNAETPKIKGTCSVCHKEVTKDYEATDTVSVVTYGYYPQTLFTDATTITSLNALTSASSNGWYTLDNKNYYAKRNGNPYSSGYVFSDGATEIVKDQEYWFKVEPIQWKVLSNKDGKLTVVSSALLDAHRYDDSSNNYANSEIRDWLNSDFYNVAFSKDKTKIVLTTVDNSANTTDSSENSYACSNTDDYVYLLSYKDCNTANYVPSGPNPTDWAWANYAAGNVNYWTRSPLSTDASYAVNSWDECTTDSASVSDADVCVRPAITIKVS